MFNHLSVKAKLYSVTAIIAVIFAFLGAFFLFSLNKINGAATEIADVWMARVDITGALDGRVADYRKEQLGHIMADGSERKQIREDNMKKFNAQIQAEFDKYEKLITDPAQQVKVKQLREEWAAYVSESETYLRLSRQNQVAAAREEVLRLLPAFEAFSKKIRELKESATEGGSMANQKAEVLYGKTLTILTVVIIAAIIITAIPLVSLTRMIGRRLNVLVRTIREFAKGDLRETIPITIHDELGSVAESVNTMSNNLKKLLHQIQKTSSNLAASSEELTASADQSTQMTQSISTSIADVSNLSGKQMEAVDSAALIIEQISTGVEETAATAKVAAENAKQAVASAQEGNVSIKNAVEQMNSIEQTVNQSAEVVTKLGDRSNEIGQIVDTIAGIAGQTNLLALNAAIEAARAGEMGKGFAVVAEEVRKLAEQSQEAAEKIASLIGVIQTDTEQAVVAMNSGTQEVKAGARVVDTAGQQFMKILEMVNDTNRQSNEIAKTMEGLADGTEKIVASVREVEESSKNVSAEAQGVSAATQEQTASMEQIAGASRNLATLAQELQEATTRFKL